MGKLLKVVRGRNQLHLWRLGSRYLLEKHWRIRSHDPNAFRWGQAPTHRPEFAIAKS